MAAMIEAPNSGAVVAMPTNTIPTTILEMFSTLAMLEAPSTKKLADLNRIAKEAIKAAK
ncbi:hypothetical protein ES707_21949 [subsurface metagenome]